MACHILLVAACGLASCTDAKPPSPKIETINVGIIRPDTIHETLDAAIHAELDTVVMGAMARTGGQVSVTAIDYKSGMQYDFGGDKPVFMGSLARLPIMFAAHARASRRSLSLDSVVLVTQQDLQPGSEIAERFAQKSHGDDPNARGYTISQLIAEMLYYDDDTATDILLRVVGGPAGVNEELGRANRKYTRLDRSMTRQRADFAQSPSTFVSDRRDRGTTDELASLAAGISILGAPSASRQLRMPNSSGARQTRTRIVAGVPFTYPTEHISADFGAAGEPPLLAGDVGTVVLPGGRGRLAIAIVASNSTRPLEEVDAALADVVRTLYMAWTRWMARAAE